MAQEPGSFNKKDHPVISIISLITQANNRQRRIFLGLFIWVALLSLKLIGNNRHLILEC